MCVCVCVRACVCVPLLLRGGRNTRCPAARSAVRATQRIPSSTRDGSTAARCTRGLPTDFGANKILCSLSSNLFSSIQQEAHDSETPAVESPSLFIHLSCFESVRAALQFRQFTDSVDGSVALKHKNSLKTYFGTRGGTMRLAVSLLLTTAVRRVLHVERVMGLHPTVLDSFYRSHGRVDSVDNTNASLTSACACRTFSQLMWEPGPLLMAWRPYVLAMVPPAPLCDSFLHHPSCCRVLRGTIVTIWSRFTSESFSNVVAIQSILPSSRI